VKGQYVKDVFQIEAKTYTKLKAELEAAQLLMKVTFAVYVENAIVG
jgi:hypothetical protein